MIVKKCSAYFGQDNCTQTNNCSDIIQLNQNPIYTKMDAFNSVHTSQPEGPNSRQWTATEARSFAPIVLHRIDPTVVAMKWVMFENQKLGLTLGKVVKGQFEYAVIKSKDAMVMSEQLFSILNVGDRVVMADAEPTKGKKFQEILEIIQHSNRPLQMGFTPAI